MQLHPRATSSSPRVEGARRWPAHAAPVLRAQPTRRDLTPTSRRLHVCFLADSVQPGRCRTTSTDVPELSELVYYHGRVRQGASRPTSARSGGSATPLPNTALERAGQPAGEQLWVGWRVRGGSEPALARPSGSAGGTCARARLAEPVRGIGRPPTSDLVYATFPLRFARGGMFACPRYVVSARK